jgi:hypothetical protein
MRTILRALALLLAISLGAKAAESKGSASHSSGSGGGHSSDSGLFFLDLFFNLLMVSAEVAAVENAVASAPPPPEGYLQRFPSGPDEDPPPPYWIRARRHPQAREGLLFSFGLGGGSMYVSNQSPSRTGAFDLDLRLGYGFSDRFQFFMDLDLGAGSYANGLYGNNDLATWTFTFRGQTVLVGDRAGNGLNVNFGAGLGGVTRNNGCGSCGYADSSPVGLALAGGLSYDARLTPWFSLSPELFYSWHQIPIASAPGHDVASIYGLRVNFLWYLH